MPGGSLHLIGTPIGNLGDLSERAARAIRECDLLLCEDTRVVSKLLRHIGASPPTESFHEHSEREKVARIADRIESGDSVALVSDAGLPLISDPGFPLVREVISRGLRVEAIPGPFAGVLALVLSGLPPSPFAFLGFLPRRSAERRALFRRIQEMEMTVIVYESPHRIVRALEDLAAEWPQAEIAVARELTKLHEEVVRGSAAEVVDQLRGRDRIRGEITLVIGPLVREIEPADPESIRNEFLRLRDSGMRRTDAVKVLAVRFSLSKRELYDMLSD
ncbi:MAG: 16S rRNA (cytidine(1402)-2'-O)-methyltransferase [Acidobacteria bacterium]|nr:16S rRNA (cytidine(1402)-2'-O)-methyltransferase [Acidobacteriota bacterium]